MRNDISRRAVLATLGALTLSSCAKSNQKLIGVIPKGRSHVFWQTVHAGANKAAQEKNVEINWNGPATEMDIPGQIQIVEAMINRRVDAICLAPIDTDALVNVVERANKENIPVVIFDSGINTQSFVAQVATDNYQAGVLAGQRMGQLLNGKGNILMVMTQAGAASTMAREAGFEDTLKKQFPGIAIVARNYGNSEVAKSLSVAENMLTAHPEVDAVFGSNESSSVGALQALRNRRAKAKLVGFDWSPQLKEGLEAGLIDSLVVQNPFQMGYEAVISAMGKLEGKSVQKVNHLAARLISKADLTQPDVQQLLNPDLKKYLG